jgi:hypothetical protein
VGEVGVPVGVPAGGGMAEYGGPRSRTRDRAASRNSIPRACPGALAGDPGIADANVSVSGPRGPKLRRPIRAVVPSGRPWREPPRERRARWPLTPASAPPPVRERSACDAHCPGSSSSGPGDRKVRRIGAMRWPRRVFGRPPPASSRGVRATSPGYIIWYRECSQPQDVGSAHASPREGLS